MLLQTPGIQTPAFIVQLDATKRDRRAKNNIFRHVSERVRDIGFAAALGNTAKARKITGAVLTSHNAKVWGLMKACGMDVPLEELNEMARRLDLSARFDKPVRVYEKRKCSGGTRQICVLPEDLMAAHYIIGEVVSCQTNLVDHVYARRGKGRDALVRDALEAINAGYRHISLLDIKNCYSSFNPAFLEKLPLHQRFVKHTLRLENLTFAMQEPHKGEPPEADTLRKSSLSYSGAFNTGAPTGLMQGSPASWPILARMWNDLPPIDDEKAKVFVYVDEVLIVAKTAARRGEIKDAVVRFLTDHPAGPLELETQDYDPGKGFELLGYDIAFVGGGRVAVARLSDRTHERLEGRLSKLLQGDGALRIDRRVAAARYLVSVLRGHPEAVDCDEWLQRHLEEIWDYDFLWREPFQ